MRNILSNERRTGSNKSGCLGRVGLCHLKLIEYRWDGPLCIQVLCCGVIVGLEVWSDIMRSNTIDHSLKVVEQRLSDDQTITERTTISVQQLVQLTELCLRSTYFKCQNKFYEQTDGAAMGSPMSPIIANLFMEHREEAIQSAHSNLPFRLTMRLTSFSLRYRPEWLGRLISIDSLH